MSEVEVSISRKCGICNRPLTNIKSMLLGIGPVCAKNKGYITKRKRRFSMTGHRKTLKGYKRKEDYKSWPDTVAFQEEIYIKRVRLTHELDGSLLLFPIEYTETNVPLHAVHHSPDGFGWGDNGNGSYDLAMNIVEEILIINGHKGEKVQMNMGKIFNETNIIYHNFCQEFITKFSEDGGSIPYTDALSWVNKRVLIYE